MFQLIVAVISIALVAALAIASIFYGGEAFTKSSEKANVTALVNQAQQISGAYQLYKTDNGSAPAAIGDLTTGNYLASLPTPPKVALGTAAWAFNAGVVEIALKADTADTPLTNSVCVEVSRQAGVVSGGQFECTGTGATLKFAFKL
jgi:hypothetical protein